MRSFCHTIDVSFMPAEIYLTCSIPGTRDFAASGSATWRRSLLSVILTLILLTGVPAATATTIRPVPDVQRALTAQGFDSGTPDGFWGKKSVTALRSFQKSRGLPETGVIDDAALAILLPATVVKSKSLPDANAVFDKIKTVTPSSASAAPPTTPVRMDPASQQRASGNAGAWTLFLAILTVGGFVFLVRRGRRVK